MGRGGKGKVVVGRTLKSVLKSTPNSHPTNLGNNLDGREIQLSSKIIEKAVAEGRELNIVVDIDNTLFPIDHALGKIGISLDLVAVQRYEEAVEEILRHSGREDLFHPQTHEDRTKRAELISDAFAQIHSDPELMYEIGSYEGAREVLHQLSDMGIRIHVVTHRSTMHKEATEEWLEMMDIPRDSVKVDWDNKIEWCKAHGVSVIIDDHPDIIREAHQEGIAATSLSWPYSKIHLEETGSFSAKNWLEIGEHVIDLLEKEIKRELE